MAFDAYMFFQGYDNSYLKSESQVQLDSTDSGEIGKLFSAAGAGNIFEITDFDFDIEQTLNIGSQSSGVGSGKITFNPFSITRRTDLSSPTFFLNACQGKPFQRAVLGFRKAAGGKSTGLFYLGFVFKLVAVNTIAWSGSDGDEATKEVVTFQYGGIQIKYAQQNTDGSLKAALTQGWNKIKNVSDTETNPITAS